jgi:hypothetical protein
MITSTPRQDTTTITTFTDMGPGTGASTSAAAFHKRISWGAVFAGALLAIVTQLALTLLGAGIGLSSVDPLEERNPMEGIGIGAMIWYGVSTLISLYVGGLVAGRLAGAPRRTDGLLHGLLTWGLVTLFTFYLLTTAVGRLISGVGGVAGRVLTTAGQGISAVAPQAGEAIQGELQERGVDMSDVKREARLLLRQTGKTELDPNNLERQARAAGGEVRAEAGQSASNPQAADDNFDDVIDRLASRADNIGNAADRDAAVNVVMQRTGKSRAESEQVVDNWISTGRQAQAKFQQVKTQAGQKARQAGDAAASGLSKAAIYSFLGLLLGAAAAGFGGRQATPTDLVDSTGQRIEA